ncbi:helix-turn-helix transcriptional regulator [Lewinella sp. W8]|uniref:helix-turn-helix transcriptional regulator n=1 Tax=Lewinella sp. W8 TaxID=2528208 RepID=UPI001067F75F|nr:helix-turn-helix transcriptional regulator [Lewinella sp. W8]MTB52060.1 helix-turn-helix domain-containing protein [Lewinella sp. W8]
MRSLKRGEFFGDTNLRDERDGLTFTDTVYTHARVDWHHHEHPYFTYLLAGKLLEKSRRHEHRLTGGSLLFHHWDDTHRNEKPPGYARGFHVEITGEWFDRFGLKADDYRGFHRLADPGVRLRMMELWQIFRRGGSTAERDVELLNVFDALRGAGIREERHNPPWVHRLREILYEDPREQSLTELAASVGVHPVHLSRNFRRHFGYGFSAYRRLIRNHRSALMLRTGNRTLSEVAHHCGYADQSHFIREYKQQFRQLPSQARREVP